jgi:hypothetical protein
MAFEFHLVKKPQNEARARLPGDQSVSSLTPLDLLDVYFKSAHVDSAEAESLQKLAGEILREEQNGE